MDFDQNITRPDLLPPTLHIAVLVGIALVGVLAWAFAHRILHRRREELSPRTRFLILLPIGTAGAWCLYQLAGRLLYLAGAWPLWLAALATAASVEAVSLLYEHECAVVPPRLARAFVFCRMLAVAITLFILMQPVYVSRRTRTVRRRVAILLDESSSMNRIETQWTLGERLDMAQALGLVRAEDRHLATAAESAEDLRARFRDWQQRLAAAATLAAAPEGEGADAPRPSLDDLARDAALLDEWRKPVEVSVRALAETVSDTRYTAGRDASKILSKCVSDLAASGAALSASDLADRPPAETLAACAAVADALERFLLHLPRALDIASAALWDSLPDARREEITRHVNRRRTLLAQAILAGSERRNVPALYDRLASRYDVDFFRFGNGVQRISDINAHFRRLATNALDAIDYIPGGTARDADSPAAPKEAPSAEVAAEVAFQSSTDFTRALEAIAADIPAEELAGILLLTDGRHTGDAGVEAISRRLGQASVPVSTILIGGTSPLRDVAIADVRASESVYQGDRVRITADLSAIAAKGEHLAVRLYCNDLPNPVDTNEFDIASDDWSREVRLHDLPEEDATGIRHYRIEADILQGETITANNAWETDVSISDDRTAVLLVDQRPRWEYRYLRNLFYGRDKSIHLQYWLVEPDSIAGQSRELPPASASREFGDAEAGGLPASRDEWRQFDVLIFGDVGEDVLTPEVVDNIRFCVEERGAMAVFLSGPKSMPYGIHSTAFRDILPVVPSPLPPANLLRGPEDSFRVTLTPSGRAHEIMALSSSPSENEQIWADQPEWSWRIPIEDVKPGAEVLAYARPSDPVAADAAASPALPSADTPDDAEAAIARLNATRRNQTRNALLVVRGQGRGRVAMLMTDRTWRLRYRVGDTYHHRFWGQMMRWGVGEKLRAGNPHVRIGTDQLRYTPHEPVRVLARLADADFTPIADASPVAVLSRDGVSLSRVALQYRPDSNGMYEAVLPPLPETGAYAVTLECPDLERRLGSDFPRDRTTQFSVITARRPAEFVHATADRKIPDTMARLSGGRAVSPSRALSLWDAFGEGSGHVVDRIETNLWDSPWLFLAVLACLTAEWLLRKRGSLA